MLQSLDTVKETAVVVQAEVDDSDDKTIHFSVGPAIHGTIFDGFTDFDLDLSCLSPPGSPTPSTSSPLPDSPSPPSSPILSRTRLSYLRCHLCLRKSLRKRCHHRNWVP